jgi:hypothetical protein
VIETKQCRVRLVDPNKEIYNPETGVTVSGKDILKQMKINNVWKNDNEGRYALLQYGGQTFKFREGQMLTLPETLAVCLRRNSAICVGSDKLNGPIIPFLEIADSFELQAPSSGAVSKSPTTCPICGEDQKSFPALTRHLGQERKKHPELFEEKEKTQWETPAAAASDIGDEADD